MRAEADACVYTFSADVPDSDFYRDEVTHRGELEHLERGAPTSELAHRCDFGIAWGLGDGSRFPISEPRCRNH